MLDALRGLRWPARKRVGSALPGTHRSVQRGTSGEFSEYRLYRQGDDPKALDWRLLARSDRAFVRVSEDRSLLATWLIVDASASMQFPSETEGRVSKWGIASKVAAGLASVVHSSSDPVGLVIVGAESERRMAPRARRGVVQELVRALVATRCGGVDALAPAIEGIAQGSRIVVITDCLGDLDSLLGVASAYSAAGSELVCVHVVAAEELAPPAGSFSVRDPDAAARVAATRSEVAYSAHATISPGTRDAYLKAFRDFCERTREQWLGIGAAYTMVVSTDDPAHAARAVVAGLPRTGSSAL